MKDEITLKVELFFHMATFLVFSYTMRKLILVPKSFIPGNCKMEINFQQKLICHCLFYSCLFMNFDSQLVAITNF